MDMKNSAWFVVGLVLLLSTSVLAEQHLRLATTTSTDNSGLLALLNPAFENESGVKVDVIAVGTVKRCAWVKMVMSMCCWYTRLPPS